MSETESFRSTPSAHARRPRILRLAGAGLLLLLPAVAGTQQPPSTRDGGTRPPAAGHPGPVEADLKRALESHFAALSAGDLAEAGQWLTADYFSVAPWGQLEFREESLARIREALETKRLENYRAEFRGFHSGPAGDGARWFRAIVREKYRRDSGRKARNTFAEDLLTTGVAVWQDGRWKIRYMHQTWSDETLRRMIPILHAAQPVDPEEY